MSQRRPGGPQWLVRPARRVPSCAGHGCSLSIGGLPAGGKPCWGRHRNYLRNGAAGGQPALLAQMSEIAGRSGPVGAHLLEKPHGGRGADGRLHRVQPARVCWGPAPWAGAANGCGHGCQCCYWTLPPAIAQPGNRRGRLMSVVSGRGCWSAWCPRRSSSARCFPGWAPTLVDEAMVQQMRAGSVIVDVAIDQEAASPPSGNPHGCVNIHGVQHYAVGNMQGRCPSPPPKPWSA